MVVWYPAPTRFMAGWYLDNTHFPWSLNSYNFFNFFVSGFYCPCVWSLKLLPSLSLVPWLLHVFAISVALGVTIFSVAIVVVFSCESSNLVIHVKVEGVLCGVNKLPRG